MTDILYAWFRVLTTQELTVIRYLLSVDGAGGGYFKLISVKMFYKENKCVHGFFFFQLMHVAKKITPI